MCRHTLSAALRVYMTTMYRHYKMSCLVTTEYNPRSAVYLHVLCCVL